MSEPFDSRFASLRSANHSLRTFEKMGWLAMSEPFDSQFANPRSANHSLRTFDVGYMARHERALRLA